MDRTILENLKEDYSKFRELKFNYEGARNQKDRKKIKSEIDDLKDQMIKDYHLRNYVPIINGQKSNNDYFDFDVKEIIQKLEKQFPPDGKTGGG